MCDPRFQAPRPAGQPRWALLYGVTLPPLLALTVVEAAVAPHAARTTLRYLLTLTTIVGIAAWLRHSRPALDLAQWCACASSTVTVRVIESRPPSVPDRRPRVGAPDEDYAHVRVSAEPARR